MSATREYWAYVIRQVIALIYEQDDSFLNQSFEEAEPKIRKQIEGWTTYDFDQFIRQEFTQDDSKQLHSVSDCARTACASQYQCN